MSKKSWPNGHNDNRWGAYTQQTGQYTYQQQQQQYQQVQYEDQIQQQQIKYAVYKDLEYVLVILAQTKTVLDYFQNDQQNPMIDVAINRLITQLNLSNSVHYDQYNQTSNNKLLRNELNNCKSIAKHLFLMLSQDFRDYKQLQQFCDYYYCQNLSESNTTSRSIPLQEVQGLPQNIQLSSHILEQVISSINNVDAQYQNIKNGQKIQEPSASHLKGIMSMKQQEAQYKLQKNFVFRQYPKYGSTSQDHFKQPPNLPQSNLTSSFPQQQFGQPYYSTSYFR